MIIEREKIDSDIDPVGFERPLSQAYWLSKTWNIELPDSVLLTPEGIYAIQNLTPERGGETSGDTVLGSCNIHTGEIFIALASPMRKKQIHGFEYADHIWGRALEARIKSKRGHRSAGVLSGPTMRIQSAEPLLRDLEAMLKGEDEPDFLHRPSPYAYKLTKQLVKDLYTHYVGSAPVPTIAPDGDGGATVEWMSAAGNIVRLIVPPDQDAKHYIYTKDLKRSHIDYEVSGLVIAQQLRSVFTD